MPTYKRTAAAGECEMSPACPSTRRAYSGGCRRSRGAAPLMPAIRDAQPSFLGAANTMLRICGTFPRSRGHDTMKRERAHTTAGGTETMRDHVSGCQVRMWCGPVPFCRPSFPLTSGQLRGRKRLSMYSTVSEGLEVEITKANYTSKVVHIVAN